MASQILCQKESFGSCSFLACFHFMMSLRRCSDGIEIIAVGTVFIASAVGKEHAWKVSATRSDCRGGRDKYGPYSDYLFHPTHILSRPCIDANLIARVDEQRDVYHCTGFQCGRFRDVVCGVAAHAGFSAHYFQVYEVGRLDGDDDVAIDQGFYGVPFFEEFDDIADLLSGDGLLVVGFGVHEDVVVAINVQELPALMLDAHFFDLFAGTEAHLDHTPGAHVFQVGADERTPVSGADVVELGHNVQVVIITYYHAVAKIGGSCISHGIILLPIIKHNRDYQYKHFIGVASSPFIKRYRRSATKMLAGCPSTTSTTFLTIFQPEARSTDSQRRSSLVSVTRRPLGASTRMNSCDNFVYNVWFVSCVPICLPKGRLVMIRFALAASSGSERASHTCHVAVTPAASALRCAIATASLRMSPPITSSKGPISARSMGMVPAPQSGSRTISPGVICDSQHIAAATVGRSDAGRCSRLYVRCRMVASLRRSPISASLPLSQSQNSASASSSTWRILWGSCFRKASITAWPASTRRKSYVPAI